MIFALGDAWNLSSEGKGVGSFVRLVSPAEGVSALALTHFNSCMRAFGWPDTPVQHTVRTTTTTTQGSCRLLTICAGDFCCAFMWSQFNGEHAGAAMRRRQRRLRQWLRHERLSRGGVRVELYGDVPEQLPLQAAGAQLFFLDLDEAPAARGSRPDRLTEVRPQERDQQHTVEQIISAPMLDVPVPLMEEQLLVDAFAPHDIQVPEQVIEVPKVLIDELSARTPVREPQLAEQLVEVPTIISF